MLEAAATETQVKVTKVFPGMRYALAGTKVGPAVPALMACLGARESVARLRYALQRHAPSTA